MYYMLQHMNKDILNDKHNIYKETKYKPKLVYFWWEM